MAEKVKPVPHPAKFSPEILSVLQAWVRMEAFFQDKRQRRMRILDPFGGTGLVHALPGKTFAVELEPEWALQHPRTQVGNALALPWRKDSFDCVVTSPCYGSRMADSHNAKDESKRIGYRFQLGRMPSEGSSAVMQWGQEYRRFHLQAWTEVVRVLRPGSAMLLNISDHVRNKERQHVSAWHCDVLHGLGMTCFARRDVPTRRMRFGSNHEARVECEHVFAFRMPG